ncbi:MAG TPA: hypothetical protein VL919_16430, partial [Vicinamibacterales bacterium]|nr:hypothetical protein [Vicinamibacterales bacterium]
AGRGRYRRRDLGIDRDLVDAFPGSTPVQGNRLRHESGRGVLAGELCYKVANGEENKEVKGSQSRKEAVA